MSSHDFTTLTGAGGYSASHPDHIGPYRIRQVLGEGGMGVVYLADRLSPISRRVAVKVLKGDLNLRVAFTSNFTLPTSHFELHFEL